MPPSKLVHMLSSICMIIMIITTFHVPMICQTSVSFISFQISTFLLNALEIEWLLVRSISLNSIYIVSDSSRIFNTCNGHNLTYKLIYWPVISYQFSLYAYVDNVEICNSAFV